MPPQTGEDAGLDKPASQAHTTKRVPYVCQEVIAPRSV